MAAVAFPPLSSLTRGYGKQGKNTREWENNQGNPDKQMRQI
jgi:hypothetical protein